MSVMMLALLGLVLACFSCILGMFLFKYFNKPQKNDLQPIEDEIESICITIDEVRIEKNTIQEGLTERTQQYSRWKKQQSPKLVFFNPEPSSEKGVLSRTHDELDTCLNNYPKFNAEEALILTYLVNFHLQFLAHHAFVAELASKYFDMFDSMFNALVKREFSPTF